MQRRKLHVRARSEQHTAYVGQRTRVPDLRTPWEVVWPTYEPIEFTHPSVEAGPVWADAADAAEVSARCGRALRASMRCGGCA
jgi:hypothetical protein